jgi:hypothetical protein
MFMSPRMLALAGVIVIAAVAPAAADQPHALVVTAPAGPPLVPSPVLEKPTPHVGFYTVHPRVGLSTYFSLSSSWPGTQTPLPVIAKVHAGGATCGSSPASDPGSVLGTATLTRENHHTVWKEWTPAAKGSYTVCTWLGDPIIARGTSPLIVAPQSAGVTRAGVLVSGLTSKAPLGAPRAVFPTAPAHVYARFALSGVGRGKLVTIEFRDTNGHVLLTRARSRGPALAWYGAQVSRDRLRARLGYWLASVRVGSTVLGRVHFLVPNYPSQAPKG